MARAQAELYGIGAVVATLQQEFPEMDVTVSKVRFLEATGLVKPTRTPSGYRKFSPRDIDRLRYVLRMQRDHFLPLKVIGEHLDKIDRGFEVAVVEAEPRVPDSGSHLDLKGPTLTSDSAVKIEFDELVSQSGLSARDVDDILKLCGLTERPGSNEEFGIDTMAVVDAAAKLHELGIDTRNLRLPVFNAAKRQSELIEALVTAEVSSATSDQERRAASQHIEGVAAALLSLQSAVLTALLRNMYEDRLNSRSEV